MDLGLTKIELHFNGVNGERNISYSVEDGPPVAHNTNNDKGIRIAPIDAFSGTLCSLGICVLKYTATSKPKLASVKVRLIIFTLDVGC